MATLSREVQNWYRGNLASQATQASSFVSSAVQNTASDKVKVAKEITNAAMATYGENAKTLSNQLYDYVMSLEDVKKFAKSQNRIVDHDFIRDYIDYIADEIYNEQYENLEAMVENLIYRTSSLNMIKNCDKTGVRYARIPSMFNTCAFCIMLASRGFVYHSEESAGGTKEFHPNCRCIVVPSSTGTLYVDDYDLDLYYTLYKGGYDAAVEEYGKRFGMTDELKYSSKLAISRVLEQMRKKYQLH